MANVPSKPTAPVKKESSASSGIFAALTVPLCLVVSALIFFFVLAAPSHYTGGDVSGGEPIDVFGIVHRGGYLVPIVLGYVLMVIVFSIERFIVIGKATGTTSMETFVRKIQAALNSGNIDGAAAECDKQKGSVANVIKAGLKKYRDMESE